MKKMYSVPLAITLSVVLASCAANTSRKIISKPESVEISKNSSFESIESKDSSSEVSTSESSAVPTPGSNAESDTSSSSQSSGSITIPSSVSNTKIVYWQPAANKEHRVPVLASKFKTLFDKYGGYNVGDITSKVIYLTFDEGYENGYTPVILDTLKKNNVKAAFFVTRPYIKSNPDLIRRMVYEGHIVGNHTNTHPSMPDKSNEQLVDEIESTAGLFKDVTGKNMPKFLRPPMGEWSERTLYITKSLGYKTILWSMAYKDYDTKNQPGKQAAINFVNTYYHNGAIMLLHAVSKSNTEALGDIIKNLLSNGYRFAPLTELK